MFSTLGHICLAIACIGALVMAVGGLSRRATSALLLRSAKVSAVAVAVAFIALVTAFVVSDFGLKLVTTHSHTDKPVFFRIAGAWGNHEGSMLLWALVSALYIAGFATWAKDRIDPEFYKATLGALGVAAFGLCLFVATVSSPFVTLPSPPPQGQGLNPLLQDVGLVIHPPVLYAGYVGLLIPWGLATGTLLTRTPARAWAQAVKPWIYIAMAFLTSGIVLGSWWAYRELGWGGWWFWDPVENVSVIPWLIGVALAHSVMTCEKRGDLLVWSLTLAVLAFVATLIGTFLVRSGLLVSVHAFAADPERGLAILGYLTVLLVWPVALIALRPPATSESTHATASRDTAMRFQNVLMIAMAATVLLGTIYPPVTQALGQAPLSVGAPYYALTVVPLMVAGLVLMAVGTSLRWRQGVLPKQTKKLSIAAAAAVAASTTALILGSGLTAALALGAGIGVLVMQARRPDRNARGKPVNVATLVSHAGVAIFAVAAAANTIFAVEGDREVRVGDTVSVGDYTLALQTIVETNGPNYLGATGRILINGATLLEPEYRIYPVRQIPTTEADIRTNILRDLRVTLNLVDNPPDAEPVWAIRFHRQPAMIWLWIGALLTSLGLFLAAARALRVRP